MKSPEEVKIEFTREWIRKAENDFSTAMHLNESGSLYVYATVEDATKALAVAHQVRDEIRSRLPSHILT